MNMREKFQSQNTPDNISVEDYESESFYPLLKRLPAELAKNCIHRIETLDMNDSEAITFIQDKIDQRAEVLIETNITDANFQAFVDSYEGDLFSSIEQDVFNDTSLQIGHGTTAKVHTLETASNDLGSIAVKYLISPNSKTISTENEEHILKEVERLHTIEQMETKLNGVNTKIKVPHTYFQHKSQTVECYGMQKIAGPNLEGGAAGIISDQLIESLAESGFDDLDLEDLNMQIEEFFEIMHQYCLHGDMKPANMMIDSDGTFYVIDFGQSVLLHEVPKGGEEQFDNLLADEIKIAKRAVRSFYFKYKEIRDQKLSK